MTKQEVRPLKDTLEMDMREIHRETDTEKRVRGCDVHQIVAIIIELEDESAGLRKINMELLETLKQVRTDYHKVHTAYEELVIELGGDTILSKEIARAVLDRIDDAIAKATGETI